jgi:anaerobic selenocysteine-containing dehydrogenase
MSSNTRRTTCNLDCPDACAILAEVVDGKVTALRGDPSHPVTQGFLCHRASRYPEFLDSIERVTQPLLRRDGKLVAVNWEEALGFVAAKLLAIRQESGPAAIFHYRSAGSPGILAHVVDLFFDQFGPCTGKAGGVYGEAGVAAQRLDFGVSDSNDFFDLENSRRIVLWGKNPAVGNVHLVPLLGRLRAKGTELWLIDPVHQATARLADRVLQPRPGRDYELALGVARALFDGGHIGADVAGFCDNLPAFRGLAEACTVAGWSAAAGVGEAEVRALAAALVAGPTAILVGWGLQRRQRGGTTVRALDALGAISGNLFRPGGGVSFGCARLKPFRSFGPPVEHPRLIREPLFAADLGAAEGPPVRLLWVTAGDPAAALPDAAAVARAIDAVECVVVADCWLSSTARRAEVVLPVPNLLEDSDLLGAYGHHWISESRPVVTPPPGVRHEIEILQELARRIGLESYPQGSLHELKRAALQGIAGQGASLEALRKNGAVRSPLARPQLFGDGRVPTRNGKVQLLDGAAPEPEVELPTARPGASAPLWLLAIATEEMQASQWVGERRDECIWVAVHPDAAPGLVEGAAVSVESPLGCLEAVLRLDPRQRCDVAIMPKGGAFERGQSVNALIAQRLTDIGLGAASLDCLVRLVPR